MPGLNPTATPARAAPTGATTPASLAAAPGPLRAWRYLRLAAHLLQGAATIAVVFPLTGKPAHQRLRQRWSRRMLTILGIQLQVEGAPVAPGAMLVANHISWVDIFVINAVAPAAFVSKAEVRDWPLIGWLAARNDTIFLRRGSRGHARVINAETAALLETGRNVAIFPEGTTTDGSHVLHFHGALLQPAIACGRPLQPLALSYHSPDGRCSRAPAYDGDISLGQCITSIVGERELIGRVQIGAASATETATSRRQLAHSLRQTIVDCLGAGPAQPGT